MDDSINNLFRLIVDGQEAYLQLHFVLERSNRMCPTNLTEEEWAHHYQKFEGMWPHLASVKLSDNGQKEVAEMLVKLASNGNADFQSVFFIFKYIKLYVAIEPLLQTILAFHQYPPLQVAPREIQAAVEALRYHLWILPDAPEECQSDMVRLLKQYDIVPFIERAIKQSPDPEHAQHLLDTIHKLLREGAG